MFVIQRKHITSPLRVQQVNAIYRFRILYIIYHSDFCLEHDVSETRFCTRLQLEISSLGPIGRTNSASGDREYLWRLDLN
jgi:hypothetical protein